MEFWGVEAKPGQTLDCDPGEEKYIHLSQLAIGENAKENERVSVYVHFEGKKIMLGTFTHGTCDQIGLDLVFEKKFQISHTSKNAAVFCTGYTTYIQEEDDEYPSYSDSEDEEEMVEAAFPTKENGGKFVPKALKTDSKEAKQEAKDAKQAVAKPGKPDKGSNGKPQAAKPPTKEAVRDEEDSDDEDDDDSENDEDSEDEATQDASESDEDDEDDEDDDDSDEEEEETPKVKDGKKRLAPNSAAKTPVTDKKAKLITPEGQKQDNVAAREYWDSLVLAGKKKQEGDVKKNVHVATPHPGAKQGGKKGKETPGTSKPQTPAKQTPKSATPGSGKTLGQFTCQPCKRNFNTETGLTSHNAAKHGEK